MMNSISPGKFYHHTGNYTLIGFLAVIFFGLSTTFLSAFVFPFLIKYINLVYIDAGLTAIFGVVIGSSITLGAKVGKVRNSYLLILLAFCFGFLGWFLSWVVWIYLISDPPFLIIIPSDVFEIARKLSNVGYWSIFGWTPRNGVLWFIWIFEFLFVICGSVGITWFFIGYNPFCENCHNWLQATKEIGAFEPINDRDQAISVLCSLEQESQIPFIKKKASQKSFSTFKLFTCKTCNNLHLITVTNHKLKPLCVVEDEFELETTIRLMSISSTTYTKLFEYSRNFS